MAKKYSYRFVDKKNAAGLRGALILAIVSFALLAAAAAASLLSGGNAGASIGALGLSGILLALFGFINGIRQLAKRNTARIVFAGTIASGIMFIVWLTLFLVGVR